MYRCICLSIKATHHVAALFDIAGLFTGEMLTYSNKSTCVTYYVNNGSVLFKCVGKRWQCDSMHNTRTLKVRRLWKRPTADRKKLFTSASYKHTALWTSLYGLCLIWLWATWGPSVKPFPVRLVILRPENCCCFLTLTQLTRSVSFLSYFTLLLFTSLN